MSKTKRYELKPFRFVSRPPVLTESLPQRPGGAEVPAGRGGRGVRGAEAGALGRPARPSSAPVAGGG